MVQLTSSLSKLRIRDDGLEAFPDGWQRVLYCDR